MSEGTKIGEANTVDLTEGEDSNQTEALKATKLGEISEFEKQLLGEDLVKEQDEKAQAIEKKDTEKKVEKKQANKEASDQRSEMEKFLEDESLKIFDYQNGDTVEGTVRSIEKSGVLIDFGFKSDGYVANSELGIDESGKTEVLEPGQVVSLFIEKLEL